MKFRDVLGTCWDLLRCFYGLVCFGMVEVFLDVLGCFLVIWDILRNFWTFWANLFVLSFLLVLLFYFSTGYFSTVYSSTGYFSIGYFSTV